MCGGCGQPVGLDWTTPVTTGHAARTTVAVTATTLLRAVGDQTRVSATAGGYAVRSATGGTVLASTVTELWRSVGPWPARVERAGLPPLSETVRVDTAVHRPPPVARGSRVALLLGPPADGDLDWADATVPVDPAATGGSSPGTAVEDALSGGSERVLLPCRTVEAFTDVLRTLQTPRGHQHGDVVALVGRGQRTAPPGWVDHLDDLPAEGARAVLDGTAPPQAPVTDAAGRDPAAVACWMGAALACGAVDGTRWRVSAGTGDDLVLLDAADGRGIGVRPR